MLIIIVLFLLLLILDYIVLHWGFDSRDGLDSLEWERRRQHAFPI